ncbi:MAG: cytochrome C assembly protein [Deltaproteobacteria bacterium]|nr:MAG: cytochrome C assembly protein [Deltaproteobacteria bacterium]
MRISKLIPPSAAFVAIALTAAVLLPAAKIRGFDLDRFARLPVLEGGRVKPIDSVARNSLLLIRSQQSFTWQGRTVAADEWLLDVLFRPEIADSQPVFFINDPEVLGLLGLKQTSDRYFPFRVLGPHLEKIEQQAAAAREVDSKQRTRFQGAILNLFDRIYLYYRLENTIQVKNGPRLSEEIARASDPASSERHDGLVQLAAFRLLPPPAGGKAEAWRSSGEALRAGRGAAADRGLEQLAGIADAYAKQDAALFNVGVAGFESLVALERPDALEHGRYEVLFNRAQPFYAGMVIYLLALLALFASFLWKRAILAPAAFGLLVAGALVHTAGLASRVVLQGRPPVTNLYSSAVFVGWAAVICGIFLERMYRRGIGTAVSAAAGFASLIVAHHLMGDGDTMEMMRAVLDSNFWLATHVVTITIGYSGTFLAGALAIGYAFRRQLATRIDPATTKALVSMTYGVICFALFFSFIGTVLGGIWADQSWGRFWGWDPKENGALLIVLWNALILHARFGGYVREKGIMAMAIGGNVITSLSWFGVNMLGVGLHSYGFMDGAVWTLSGFIASQLALVALCLLPPKFWKPHPAAAGTELAGGR